MQQTPAWESRPREQYHKRSGLVRREEKTFAFKKTNGLMRGWSNDHQYINIIYAVQAYYRLMRILSLVGADSESGNED